MGDSLRVRLFGGVWLESVPDGSARRIQSRKAEGLLAYLALFPEKVHPREALAYLLWPESEREQGLHRLSTTLWTLGQALAEVGIRRDDVLGADRNGIWLSRSRIATDVGDFEEAARVASALPEGVQRRRAWAHAASLYTADLLPGHYDDWVLQEQSRVSSLFERVVDRLSTECLRDGVPELAVPAAEHAVRLDPCNEVATLRLIRLRAAGGRPDLAAAQYRNLGHLFADRPSSESLSHPSVAPTREIARPAPTPATGPGTGGAVGLDSPFYVERGVDADLRRALAARESIVLLKGARQVGKTSLLARAAQIARAEDARLAITPLQMLQADQWETLQAFLQTLTHMLAEQLGISPAPRNHDASRGANLGFWRFMHTQVLGEEHPRPMVWVVDDVDRLFGRPYGEEVFALLRSWHNERAFDPSGPWSRLTIVLAYSTEAYLFVRDLNQSPFNVGRRLNVEDFTRSEVSDLAERHGLRLDPTDDETLYSLVGGHPYLVRLALGELATGLIGVTDLSARAIEDYWVFGAHLRRLRGLLREHPDLHEAVVDLLRGRRPVGMESFHRLRSAGIVVGKSEAEARMRCGLYSLYLERQFGAAA